MKTKIKFLVYPLAIFAMSMFIIAGCSDDDSDPNFILNLEVSPTDSGTVTGAGEYQEGDQADITATAYEGWEFLNWTGDTQFLDNANSYNTTVSMPAINITLTANFQKEESNVVYGDGVSDIDGNEYITVIIGDQEWMAENLRVGKYNNGDAIPTGLSNAEWSSTTSGAYVIYDHNNWDAYGINSPEEMVGAYGKLYNWFAVDDARGLCPQGWSVPGDADWRVLVNYVVSQGFQNDDYNDPNGAGNALKSCRQVNSPLGGECNTNTHPRWYQDWEHYGFDAFGFSALPSGLRYSDGNYYFIGGFCCWWSSSEGSSADAWVRGMSGDVGGTVFHGNGVKRLGVSVRCVRNIE